MEQATTNDDRREAHHARRAAAARLRAAVALSLASLGSACLAADSMSGLGSAFRPQGGGDAPVAASGDRAGATLPGLRVIVSRTSRSVASIDGQIVHVGDTVNGMRVTQINSQGVVLVGEGGVQERLLINPSVVKRTPPVKPVAVSNGAIQ